MRKLSKEKNTAFSRYYNNSSDLELKRHLKFLQENLNTSIESSKQRYYSRMVYQLYNMQRNSRSYWSLMKIFLSNNRRQGKGWTFQSFLLQIMLPFVNHSDLPTSPSFWTNERLSSVTFSAENIVKIIQVLDHNKAHRRKISNCMSKISGDTIYKFSEMIFSQALTSGSILLVVPTEWKKGNITLIHKRRWEKA